MAEAKTKEKKPQVASVKGMYHYMNRAWRKQSPEYVIALRGKMIEWRAGDRITKVEKPFRLDRARSLGYKAKKGILVMRVVIQRGGRHKSRPNAHRRQKRFNTKKILGMNYRWVAEQKAQRKYKNLEVLNSYLIGQDGKFYFFEVIMVDKTVPEIKKDPKFRFLQHPANKFRAFRGLTSAAKKSRGLRSHARNLKVRPSLRSWKRHGK